MQFQRAVQALCDGDVDFIVIGGVAATIHGSARVTYDLDVCYSRTAGNLRRLSKALAPFHRRPRGIPLDLPFVWDEVTLRNGTIFTLQTDIGEIDLLAEVVSLGTFDELKHHSIQVDAFERQIATLDLPALIQSKKAAGREKDLAAIPELESLLEANE
jgi:hypothetical protein